MKLLRRKSSLIHPQRLRISMRQAPAPGGVPSVDRDPVDQIRTVRTLQVTQVLM